MRRGWRSIPLAVWASRYTPGRGWSAAQVLSDDRAEDIAVAMDAAGNALAVFDQDLTIVVRRHDGIGWRDPELVYDRGGPTGPRVAVNAAGEAFVWWRSVEPDGADDSYFYTLVAHAGPHGGWSVPAHLGGNQTLDSSVTVDAAGNASAFWTEQNRGVWFGRFIDGAWQGERQLAPLAASLEAAGDADGDTAVVWDSGDALHAVYFADGVPGEPVVLAGGEPGSGTVNDGGYDVAAGSGHAIALWQTDSQIEVSVGDASRWDSPEVLDDVTLGSPRIAMTGSGDAIAVWLRRAAVGDSVELRAAAFR
jgi:hypothetical protein